MKELQRLKNFQFWIKSGNRRPRKVKTKDAFGRRSPLLIDQYELTALNKYLTEQSGTYKPILPLPQSSGEERLNTIPDDLQETVDRQMHPQPKFGSYHQSNDSN